MPEKRVDKNGRVVTRHIKTALPAGTSVFVPVKPSLPHAVRDSQREASLLMDTLFARPSSEPGIYLRSDGKAASDGLIPLLGAVPADSLNAVLERVASMPQQERDVVSEMLSEVDRRYNTHSWNPEFVEGILHYSAELAPYAVAYSEAGTSAYLMHNAVMHIQAQVAAVFKGREPRLLFADEAEKEVIRGTAVNHLLTGAYFETKNVVTLSWIGKNLDRIEDYKEVIRARGTMDRKIIEGLMESEAPSVAGGYL